MERRIYTYPTFWFTLTVYIFFMMSILFKESIKKELTAFLMPFYYLMLLIFMAIAIILSFIFLIRYFNKSPAAAIPLILAILSILFVVIFSPHFENYILRKNFEDGYEMRMELVEMVVSGELTPKENGIVRLSSEYVQASEGGDFFVAEYDGRSVFYFYVDEGLLEYSTGFAFLTDNFDAEQYGYIDLNLLKDYGNGWYYCSTR